MRAKAAVAALVLPAFTLAGVVPRAEAPEIVGGTSAAAGEFPFIVSLRQSGSHICGGSLVSGTSVLTAAHCCVDQTASQLSIRAGSLSRTSGGVVVNVKQIIVNPAFSGLDTLDNDVCILKLSSTVATSSTISYATLPAVNEDPVAGQNLVVAGWGTTSSGGQTLPTNLLKVTVPVVSRATCQNEYSVSQITNNMFCAAAASGGKDSCQGDSGGPIVDASKTLVGTVSWGQGCALAGYAGVYARVGTQLSFIDANL